MRTWPFFLFDNFAAFWLTVETSEHESTADRMPTLDFDGATFVFRSRSRAARTKAREAGFNWSKARERWYTQSPVAAAALRDFATASAERQLQRTLIDYSPWLSPLPPLPVGMKLKPHQPEAVYYALDRNRSYLGLDAGLGKTVVAAVVAAALRCPIVYISPPFLVLNVEEEFRKWAPSLTVDIYPPNRARFFAYSPDVLIVPDSLVARDEAQAAIRDFLGLTTEAALFVDEAHRFKDAKAQRTRALFGRPGNKAHATVPGIRDLFSREIYMSGTPMPNRPIELYPILSLVAPETLDGMTEFEFGRRYCAGKRGRFGWDFSGASNVKELASRVIHPRGPFMLRQKKALLNLPPKTEEVFVLSADMSPRLATMEKGIGAAYATIDDVIKKRLAKKADQEELHTATYRRLLGLEKVKPASEYISSILDESEDTILVFAYHKEVIEQLEARLAKYRPLVITGDTSKKKRHELVKKFQSSKKHRLMIGNYHAMGIGFTLTRANRVARVEFDWVPGVNDQAGDRAHRIGQTRTVLDQYFVYRDSLDKAVVETLLRKRKSIAHI